VGGLGVEAEEERTDQAIHGITSSILTN